MKWLGGVMLVLLSLTGNAQKTVFQNLTWEQAAELAQKENKIILVDAMREPATPEARKQKDKEEAVWQKVAANLEFCKQHVVAIRIDMASEAGKEFAPKLVMNMYPTYGFFMPNGDILGTVSPFLLAKNPELFLARGKKAWEQAEVKRNNKRSIVFEEIGLKEALEKAKKENKLVFIDAYTAWCQPCVMMGKNVFTLDKVADFYNRNFINLKIDFGKEKELAEKYAVRGYPAFLFLNGNGKLVHAGGGYTEADAFIGYGQEALKKAEGIVFFKGTWQQALEQARKENKLIFMDCYTSWCGPCKMLAKEVFTDPEVAAFFNEKFVNVKVDMEKGEGMELLDGCSCSLLILALDLDGDGLALLDTHAHQSHQLAQVAGLAVLFEGGGAGKALDDLDQQAGGTCVDAAGILDSVLKFLHDHFSLLGIPFIMLRGHRPRRRQPNPAAGYTTYIINLIRCFFIIPFR